MAEGDDDREEGGDSSPPGNARPERERPVFRDRRPGNALQQDEIEQFLVALATTGQFNQAAYGIGRSPQTFRKLAYNDPGFAMQMDDALQDYSEMLQGEAVHRAVRGVVEPVFGKDGLVGWKRVYSDRLLELELKASNKMKYYPPAQTNGLPVIADNSHGPKTGVALLPERSRSQEDWEREHGAAAKGKLSQKVTRPVVPRKVDAG